MGNPRLAALEALRRTQQDGAYSNIVISSVLEDADLDARDKAFASALYYGTLERLFTLDYYIRNLCSSPFNKLAPAVRDCLRLGLYQIKFMNRVPDNAAVNEMVKIAKKKCSYASGMVNAVLRRACREEISLPKGADAEAMSIKYSCAKWIVETLMEQWGADVAEGYLSASLEAPPVYIRVNTCRISPDELKQKFEGAGCSCERTDLPETLVLKNIGDVEGNPLYKDGLFHVEDMAAQWAVKALDIKEGQRVLDVCAAPGGKTFSAAEYAEGSGEVVAIDLYENRVRLIKEGAERLGLANIKTFAADSSVYDAALGEFDRVLCDVPCSGLGIIRRKPDIKYKKQDDFKSLEKLQLDLLTTASRYLKAGGRLVYSTCTLRKNENENIVKKFLDSNKNFSLKEIDMAGEKCCQRTFFPQKDQTDGFFVAVLEKE